MKVTFFFLKYPDALMFIHWGKLHTQNIQYNKHRILICRILFGLSESYKISLFKDLI